ncbi:hypothetical protein ANTPLA_LOCUS3804 [Anthophora plagiata]
MHSFSFLNVIDGAAKSGPSKEQEKDVGGGGRWDQQRETRAWRWGTGKRRPLRRDQGCKVTLMTQSPAAASGDI